MRELSRYYPGTGEYGTNWPEYRYDFGKRYRGAEAPDLWKRYTGSTGSPVGDDLEQLIIKIQYDSFDNLYNNNPVDPALR